VDNLIDVCETSVTLNLTQPLDLAVKSNIKGLVMYRRLGISLFDNAMNYIMQTK